MIKLNIKNVLAVSLFTIGLLFNSSFLCAQIRKNAYIDSLIYATQKLGFDESKSDSLIIMADIIEKESKSKEYSKGIVYAQRFKGWAYDYKGRYDEAIVQYLKSQTLAQKVGLEEEILMIYGDLGGLYLFMGRHEDAKRTFQMATNNAKFRKEQPKRLSTFYNNLGITYKKLGLKDSAFLM